MLGVRAVLASGFERIHRSNLVALGVLPLQFLPGESAASVGLKGDEVFDVELPEGGARPEQRIRVCARAEGGRERAFDVLSRVDSEAEVEYLRHGGLLPLLARRMLGDE